MKNGRHRVGRVDRRDAIESVGALRVVVRTVDGFDSEPDVFGGERHAVVPGDVRPQRPDDVHAAVAAERDSAILRRRHVGRQQRNDIHILVRRRQPFDHAGLDVFEDVRAEPVQRVGLAIVADDEQIVRRRDGDRMSRTSARERDQDKVAGCVGRAHVHAINRATSGTGIEP